MKTVQYDLRIVHRKKVAIGAINRKEIDRILRDMITSGEALNMEGGEIVGIMVEEKGERDCPGNCDHCSYLCPKTGLCYGTAPCDAYYRALFCMGGDAYAYLNTRKREDVRHRVMGELLWSSKTF